MPTEWEERDFGQSTLNLTRAAESRGEEVIIAAPFKMHFINGKNSSLSYFYLDELDQVEKLMRKVTSKTAPGDSVNLLLYGHGAPTTNELDYNETEILLGSERAEIEDVVEAINDNLPKDRGIKTIAPFCFSGAIHLLSHSRKNSCSAAASDFRSPSKGERNCFFGSCVPVSSYGMSITKLIKENPEISLADAHEMISEKDHLNRRRGNLSSIDYIKRIFKKGPYEVKKNWFQRLSYDYADVTPDKNYLSLTCSKLKEPHLLNSELFEDLITNTQKIIEKLEPLDNLKDEVPIFVRDIFNKNFERYVINFSDESKALGEFHQSSKYLIDQHEKTLKEKGYVDWNNTRLINAIKEELNQKTNELLRYHLYNERVELINLLYSKGTQAQIEKFENLVMCENNI